MSSLWISIEPTTTETRLMLSQAQVGPALRARLPAMPQQSRALALLLDGLATWYSQPLCAVLDADAEAVRREPERWAYLLGDLDGGQVRVEWVGLGGQPGRDRFLGAVASGPGSRRLLTFAATGLR